MSMDTRLNLASVIALREALDTALASWPEDAGKSYVPVEGTVLSDILDDLIDFHSAGLNPKKSKKGKK
jgi:hypothetical protein